MPGGEKRRGGGGGHLHHKRKVCAAFLQVRHALQRLLHVPGSVVLLRQSLGLGAHLVLRHRGSCGGGSAALAAAMGLVTAARGVPSGRRWRPARRPVAEGAHRRPGAAAGARLRPEAHAGRGGWVGLAAASSSTTAAAATAGTETAACAATEHVVRDVGAHRADGPVDAVVHCAHRPRLGRAGRAAVSATRRAAVCIQAITAPVAVPTASATTAATTSASAL